jgi:hypothetical protein
MEDEDWPVGAQLRSQSLDSKLMGASEFLPCDDP